MKKNALLFVALLMLLYSCGGKKEKKSPFGGSTEDMKASQALEAEIGTKARAMFQPLAAVAENANNPITPEKVKLGKILYYDTRLSKDGNVSCNSCHNLSTFGVDNLPFSPGDEGELGDRNSNTVLNAAFQTTQFWDGRAKDVEDQAGQPILNPVEMAIPNEQFLVDRLKGIDLYKQLFAAAFPDDADPITYPNLQNAIGAFERTLVTPGRFDDYLAGNASALTVQEKQGLKTFMEVGCTTCHMGSLLGGNLFQKFGLYGNYWEMTNSDPIDEGRAKETGNEADKYMFKVPSLRNIEKTAPYFHDGSVEDLGEATKIIAKLNLDKDLTDEQVADLVAFMNALTGGVKAEWAQVPPELGEAL
jgi:cytochrome c peroxidase